MKKVIVFTIVSVIAISFAVLFYQSFLSDTVDRAKSVATKTDLTMLHNAVKLFKLDTGRYPSQENGLIELVEQPAGLEGWSPGGYLEESTVPKDSWRNDFIYLVSSDARMPFVIVSLGADGKLGGAGDDADIHSTDLK